MEAAVRRGVGGLRIANLPCALLVILFMVQNVPAHSKELPAPGVSSANDCIVESSDFEVDLMRFAETVSERTNIPSEFFRKHFAGCSIEQARELLVKSSFAAEELGPEFDNSEPQKVIPRTMVTEKTIQPIGQYGSLNCRIILKTDPSNRVSVQGFFYFDGP